MKTAWVVNVEENRNTEQLLSTCDLRARKK